VRCEVIPFGHDLWPRLSSCWEQLGRDDSSAFLSADWVGAWISAFGAARRPTGLVWQDARGQPVGCALMSIGPAKLGPFQVRRAYLNASGEGAGCEHNDILARPEHRAEIVQDLVRRITAQNIDELALVGVREGLLREIGSHWPVAAREGRLSESPFVSLDRVRATDRTYLECLSANTRSQIRRSVRLYRERFGKEEVRAASSAEALEWFDAMLELHTRTWRDRGETGAFADTAVRDFHRRLIESSAMARGMGELTAEIVRVSFGEEAIAFLYQLRYRGRVNFYQSGLAYHDDNRLKPGLVAHALAIGHYLQMGASEYDFLGGEPEAVRYKRSLSTDVRMLAWMELPSPTSKMRLLRGLRLARRRVRKLWQRG
jgi:CelD/BcsL family acetyltransferase involved in cellulose biosynthesis